MGAGRCQALHPTMVWVPARELAVSQPGATPGGAPVWSSGWLCSLLLCAHTSRATLAPAEAMPVSFPRGSEQPLLL